jgi:hypothetical protein
VCTLQNAMHSVNAVHTNGGAGDPHAYMQACKDIHCLRAEPCADSQAPHAGLQR